MRGVLCVALVMTIVTAWAGPLLIASSDSWWHLSQIQYGIVSGDLLVHPPGEPVPLNGGVWHGMAAAVCRATELEPLTLWVILNVLVAPCLVVVAGWVSREVLGDRGTVPGAIAFSILFEGVHLEAFRELSYPRYANWIVLLAALAMALRYVRAGRLTALVGACGLGAFTAAVHLVELPLLALILGAWVVVLALLYPDRRAAGRALLVVTGTVLLALPYLWLVVVRDKPGIVPPVAGHAPRLFWFREGIFVGNSYFLDPGGEFGDIVTPAGWVALLAFPLLLERSRRDVGTALLLGAMVVPPAIALNPLVVPVFLRYWPAPDVLHRLALAMLIPWAVVAIAREAVGRSREGGPRRAARVLAWFVLAGLALGALPVALARWRGLAGASSSRDLADVVPIAPLAAFALADGWSGKRVATDPLTTRVLAGLAGTVALDRGMFGSGNYDARSASDIFQFFRNPCQSSRETIAWLMRERVAFVVHNQVPMPGSFDAAILRNPFVGADVARFLEGNPAVFERAYSAGGIQAYRVRTPAADAALAGKDMPLKVRLQALACAPPEPLRWQRFDDATDSAIIEKPPNRIRRGAVASMKLAWRSRGRGSTARKLRLHFSRTGDGIGPSGLIGRKLLEYMERRVRRFGLEQDLVPEEFQPLPLPAGQVVCQELSIRIPESAKEGRFEIRVELVPKGETPVRRLRLADSPPPGALVGEMLVE